MISVNTGCVSESGDFKNVMNSKRFHLFSFNTYKHNVYIKEFRFFHFQFNPFNNLTHWKQKSYFPKITSFRLPPSHSRHSVSLLRTSPITLSGISTGILVTSCWIRCFNSWTVWGVGDLKTWDFRQPEWYRVAMRRTLWTSFNGVSHYRNILGCTYCFDVTTSNVSFLRGPNTGERDVTASPLHDVTRMAYTTPEPHGRTRSRLLLYEYFEYNA